VIYKKRRVQVTVTTLGIDLAKNVFQIHGVDSFGKKTIAKKTSRKQLVEFVAKLSPCVIAMEACGSSHYWGRKFIAMGHEVRLISPQFVKPFVKSNKNDVNDAEGIVEAALRPSMRFVPVKSVAQQDVLSIHRVRQRLIAARTALINETRGLLGEFGIIIPQGASQVRRHLPQLLEIESSGLTVKSRRLFVQLYAELTAYDEKIKILDNEVQSSADEDNRTKRIMQIPGIGPLTATCMVASVGDSSQFMNGRQLSGWLGLVPRQHSSGGKQSLGRISKRGDVYLRMLLIHGARSVLLRIQGREDAQARWLKQLIERRGFNRACVALANKNVRTIWALLAREEDYRMAA
jgi:transposase